MKIKEIQSFPVWISGRNQLIVKVETDQGLVGWGESGLSGRELAVIGALRHFREFLLGRDPRRLGALWQEVYRSQYFEGGRVLTAALSAIDIALHDIKAQWLGIPVYELLGGSQRNSVPCFATLPFHEGESSLQAVGALLAGGWDCIRFGPPEPDPDQPLLFNPRDALAAAARHLTAVRAHFGHGFSLGIDFHHRLSVAEAASFCQRMPSATLDFLEEPIRDECPSAYRALREMTPVPFAIGEEFASKWQFLPYLEQDLTQFARLDICNVGGFTEALKVAAVAESHYIDLMPHNPLGAICTAATIHLCAAIPNVSWMEVRPEYYGSTAPDGAPVFPVQPALNGCAFDLPHGPGLGIEVDETLLAEASLRFWEPPHYTRADGSYTNW